VVHILRRTVLCNTHENLNCRKERIVTRFMAALPKYHVAVRHRRGVVSAVSPVTSPRVHSRSSHAFSAMIVIPFFPDAFLHRAIPPLRARNYLSVNYAERENLISILTYVSLGRFARRQSCLTWRRLSNAFCYSLLIYQCYCTYTLHIVGI